MPTDQMTRAKPKPKPAPMTLGTYRAKLTPDERAWLEQAKR